MYKNYIFDLYGTLADIHTDESDISLWQKTARVYTENGAAYTAEQLQTEYIKAVENEKKAVHKAHPEYKYIDIKIWVENIKGQGISEEQPYIKVIRKNIYNIIFLHI